MLMVADGVMVVSKQQQTWNDGSVTNRVSLSNGNGGLVEVDCDDASLWQLLEPLSKRYDMTIDVYSAGYKKGAKLLGASEQ